MWWYMQLGSLPRYEQLGGQRLYFSPSTYLKMLVNENFDFRAIVEWEETISFLLKLMNKLLGSS